MTYVVDIDGTICTQSNPDYENAEPIRSRIEIVNRLYDQGNIIIYCTARGMGRTNNDQKSAISLMYDFTKKQLDQWGVKYHMRFLGKPAGDVYIDDKAMRDIDFFSQMEKL
jgi:capsule biosynthesis phosphatase